VPISDTMPDEDQRQKLMPFLGKYVRASGTVYERKGTHAIAINQIEEAKDVHLTIEDQ
jgi:DNA/RNA endonuclease YhcR with UshA esterase domain